MRPTMTEAERLLREAERCNPGPWGNHSRTAAHCARAIAAACGMDGEKAYVLGLLHDIGRKFGVTHLRHAWDGYRYMTDLGYDEVARVCLTHSFPGGDLAEYIGSIDTTEEDTAALRNLLAHTEQDEYDRLIQLCDALAGSESVLDVETRMADVKRRYGMYPQSKWDANLALLAHFTGRAGQDVYRVVDREGFRL